MAIFNDGQVGSTMETDGNLDAWTGTDGTPTVVITDAHHGSNSVEFNPAAWANEDIYKSIGAQGATIFARWYLRMETDVTAESDNISALRVKDQGATSNICFVNFYNNAGTKEVRIVASKPSATYSAAYTISLNNWVCVELEIIVNATVGHYHLWIDEISLIEQSGLNTGTSNPDLYYFGHPSSDAKTRTSQADCVVISTTYNGPEAVGGATVIPSAKRLLMGVGRTVKTPNYIPKSLTFPKIFK